MRYLKNLTVLTLAGGLMAGTAWADPPKAPKPVAPKAAPKAKPAPQAVPAPRAVPAPKVVPPAGRPWVVSGLGQGYLGVELVVLTDDLRQFFKVPQGLGVMVSRVEEGSPAEEAGIKAGDVIVEVDGNEVRERWDLHRQVRQAAGETVDLDVYREGTRLRIETEVEESTQPIWTVPPAIRVPDVDWESVGDTLEDLDVEMKELGVRIGDFAVRIPDMVDWEEISDEIEEALEEAAEHLENAEFREIYADQLEDAMREWSERYEDTMEELEEALERKMEALEEIESVEEREEMARLLALEEAERQAELHERIVKRESERARRLEAREREREERLRKRLEELEERLEELEDEIDDVSSS